jgi:hypothetical protein
LCWCSRSPCRLRQKGGWHGELVEDDDEFRLECGSVDEDLRLRNEASRFGRLDIEGRSAGRGGSESEDTDAVRVFGHDGKLRRRVAEDEIGGSKARDGDWDLEDLFFRECEKNKLRLGGIGLGLSSSGDDEADCFLPADD